MAKRRGNTKERILDAALMLFSERGYDGVGVDLIAETIGLKGPSLYRHFKGKEEILNGLVEYFEEAYEENFGLDLEPGEFASSAVEFVENSMNRIEQMIHDPQIRMLRRMLAIEQFRNQSLRDLTTRYQLAGLEDFYTAVFDHMIDAGILMEEDSRLLAFEFVSPVSLMINLCDREPEMEEAALNRIQMHLELFVKTYGI